MDIEFINGNSIHVIESSNENIARLHRHFPGLELDTLNRALRNLEERLRLFYESFLPEEELSTVNVDDLL